MRRRVTTEKWKGTRGGVTKKRGRHWRSSVKLEKRNGTGGVVSQWIKGAALEEECRDGEIE